MKERSLLSVKSPPSLDKIFLKKIVDKNQLILFGYDVSRSILPLWQEKFPNDNILSGTIQLGENCVFGTTNVAEVKIGIKDIYNNFFQTDFDWYAVVFYSSLCIFHHNIDFPYQISLAITHSSNAVYYGLSDKKYSICFIEEKLKELWEFIYQLYLQCFKPKHITIPKEPLFLELAQEIKNTRNFSLYKILVDAIFDYTNIKIKTKCLGLSNWLLFDLLIKGQNESDYGKNP